MLLHDITMPRFPITSGLSRSLVARGLQLDEPGAEKLLPGVCSFPDAELNALYAQRSFRYVVAERRVNEKADVPTSVSISVFWIRGEVDLRPSPFFPIPN